MNKKIVLLFAVVVVVLLAVWMFFMNQADNSDTANQNGGSAEDVSGQATTDLSSSDEDFSAIEEGLGGLE